MENIKFYTKGEEIANAITHGAGALLSIAGLVLLIVFSSLYKTPWHIVSYTIFGSMLVLMYIESTIYHSLINPKAKKVFRIMDHSAIYLLIAGTYTPFCLTVLRGPVGWTLFGIIWALAVLGVVKESLWFGKLKKASTAIYIAMGWLVIFTIRKIVSSMPFNGVILLIAGGILYTAGCYFYIRKNMKYSHAIWHMFVIGGSICHVLSVLIYMP